MKKCVALKFGRHNGVRKKLSEFAKMVEIDVGTLVKLENDEEYWDKVPQYLIDRIISALPEECFENTDINTFKSKPVEEPKPIIIQEIEVESKGLSKENQKTMNLVEFAYEGLKEAKSHADFVANINLMKRMLSTY